MSKKVVLAACPFCGCGRCGVRLCSEKEIATDVDSVSVAGHHAFILCDTCHATWLEPDLTTCHQYLAAIDPICPLCQAELKDEDSSADGLKGSWASVDQVNQLGWDHAVSGATRLSMEEIEAMFQGDGPIDFPGGTL